jgi:hypothetical protein
MRTLSARELNRALLARQRLLERSRLSIPKLLEAIAGIQAQYAPSIYVGLWSRLESFERGRLERALRRRSVVQGTLMRVTIHLVSAGDYWPLALGVRKPRRALWLRARNGSPSAAELSRAAAKLRRALAGRTMSRKEIAALLGGGSVVVNGVGLWLDLVRVPPSGTWERRRADLYALAEDWLGEPKVTPEEGMQLLVRRYLGGFGPGSRAEIADWAGVPPRAVEPAIEAMRLRRFLAEDGAELLDLPRAPLPDPETPAPVRFLPVWDATLLVHARRTGILPEEHRSKVFNVRTPHSVNTFLVDGRVAGTWRETKGRIELSPFGRLDRASREELEAEAKRLADLWA